MFEASRFTDNEVSERQDCFRDLLGRMLRQCILARWSVRRRYSLTSRSPSSKGLKSQMTSEKEDLYILTVPKSLHDQQLAEH